MRYLKLGFDLFTKRLLINILLIIQLVISLVAINFSVARVQALGFGLNVVKQIPMEKYLCVMPIPEIKAIKGDDYFDFTRLEGEHYLGESYTVMLRCLSKSIKSLVYDDVLLENLSVPLKKGEWRAPVITEHGTNVYPVVISQEDKSIKYGDRLEVSSTNGNIFQVYVSGVLNTSQRYLNLSKSGNAATSDYFFKKVDRQIDGLMFFFDKEMYPQELYELLHKQPTRFIFFDEMNSDQFLSNAAVLSEQGYTYTPQELMMNSDDEYQENLRYYLPFCICIFAISLIGIVSFTALNMLQNAHYFSILYLCGSRTKYSSYICLGYVGIVCLATLIISFFVYTLGNLSGIMNQMDLYFTNTNILITGAILLLVVAVSMIIPIVMMKRFSVTEYIRKFEK